MTRHTSRGRARFRQFLLSVATLHALAIAAYYVLDIAEAPARIQGTYAWGWMGLTVAVVLVGIRRVKRARGRPAVIRRPDT